MKQSQLFHKTTLTSHSCVESSKVELCRSIPYFNSDSPTIATPLPDRCNGLANKSSSSPLSPLFRHLFHPMFLLPLTNSCSETWLKFRKRVRKRIRAVAVVWVNFFRLVVALLAGWAAGHEQRNVRTVEENGSISTQRLVFLVCWQRCLPFCTKTVLTVLNVFVFCWARPETCARPGQANHLVPFQNDFLETFFFGWVVVRGDLKRAGEIF
jgi:hypothetical protein